MHWWTRGVSGQLSKLKKFVCEISWDVYMSCVHMEESPHTGALSGARDDELITRP